MKTIKEKFRKKHQLMNCLSLTPFFLMGFRFFYHTAEVVEAFVRM